MESNNITLAGSFPYVEKRIGDGSDREFGAGVEPDCHGHETSLYMLCGAA